MLCQFQLLNTLFFYQLFCCFKVLITSGSQGSLNRLHRVHLFWWQLESANSTIVWVCNSQFRFHYIVREIADAYCSRSRLIFSCDCLGLTFVRLILVVCCCYIYYLCFWTITLLHFFESRVRLAWNDNNFRFRLMRLSSAILTSSGSYLSLLFCLNRHTTVVKYIIWSWSDVLPMSLIF